MKTHAPLLCLALLATGPALAQNVESGPQTRFEARTGPVTVVSVQPPLPNASEYAVKVADLDANGDRRLSRAEVPDDHALHYEWKLVDRNRDGFVTDEELANWK
ncbi:EF-hand domain-containing protein [Arenimonas aestuarii]